MKFVLNDGGRAMCGFEGSTGDCVVRAVTIATEQNYEDVYHALGEGCREQRLTKLSKKKASARNGVNVGRKWFKDYMTGLGWKWTPTMLIGQGCKVHLHDGELPMGRLIVSVSKHYTAVIDGVVHDTHDPQREIAYFEPDRGQVLKANQGRNQNGVFTISRRCVYGYWSKVA